MNKKDGESPSFLSLPGIFQNVQQGLIFIATFGTHVDMFLNERHDPGRIMRFYFLFHKFIQFCVHLFTGHFLVPDVFQHSDKFQDDLILHFLPGVEFVPDPLNEICDFHAKSLMDNFLLILLLLEGGQQVLWGDVFQRQASFEPQACIVQ